MTGYNITVELRDASNNLVDPVAAGLLFAAYDNDELVVEGVGAEFTYLVPDPSTYVGSHTISLAFYYADLPENKSTPVDVRTVNFTLPALTLSATCEVF